MSEYTDNSLRESIDKIEPDDGAKDRMFQNIMRKAADLQKEEAPEKAAKPKVVPLNRVLTWAISVAACLAVAVAGIKIIPNIISAPPQSNVQVVNPYREAESAEEFAKELGISIDAPEGSENVIYNIISDSIANLDFEYGGNSYTFRASKQSEDFSGIYGTTLKQENIDAAAGAVLQTIDGEFDYFKLTWKDGETTYILMNGSEISADDITAVYELVKR